MQNGRTTTQSISIGTDPSPDFSVVEAQNNGQSILSIQPVDFILYNGKPAAMRCHRKPPLPVVTGYGLSL